MAKSKKKVEASSDATPATSDRRQRQERRNSSDRRRGSDSRRVSVEIGPSILRYVLVADDAKGDREVLLHGSVRWKVDADSVTSLEGQLELAAALKKIAAEQRLGGARLSITLPGDLCVTRVASGSTSDVDRELTDINERSQLYLSLGSGKKCLSTKRYAMDARHEHAVTSVTNEKVLQALMTASESAGLDLRSVESSIVAACRTHFVLHPKEEKPVVLIMVDDENVQIAVSHRGRLMIEYRPAGKVTLEDLQAVVEKQWSRLLRFCQKQLHDFKLSIDHIYVLAPPDKLSATLKVLSQLKFGTALPLSLENVNESLDCRTETPDPSMTAVLGAALLVSDTVMTPEGPNLMERWIAESRKHIRPLLIRSAIPLVATLLVALGLWAYNLEVRYETQAISTRLAELKPDHARYEALRRELIATDGKLKQLTRLGGSLDNLAFEPLVARIGGCLPDDVWLDQINFSDASKVSLKGASYTEGGVFDFVQYLKNVPELKNVALLGTSVAGSQQGPTTRYDIQAVISQPSEEDQL